jgi:ATP-dependent protease ClpP protease subunit
MLQIFNYSLVKNHGAGGTYDINIDGDIVDAPTQEMYRLFWGDETSVSFRSFRNEIQAANPSVLNVYVNTTGGHVGDALAMHDYLKELESKGVTVNRIGRGIIASAGTYLILGGAMTENSLMMIHNIQMSVWGDIVQCENQVKAGRKFNDLINELYVKVTGKDAKTIGNWMNNETWFTADEAKKNNFVTTVTNKASFTNSIKPEQWPFKDKGILNQYNSFTQLNNEDMDLKKVEEAIKNGFSQFFGNSLPKEFKLPENATTEFATALVNALKPELLTEEKVTEIANKAVEDATAGDAEELGKVFVNKTEMKNLQETIIKNLGGKTTGADTTVIDKVEKAMPKNRFAGKTFFTEA